MTQKKKKKQKKQKYKKERNENDVIDRIISKERKTISINGNEWRQLIINTIQIHHCNEAIERSKSNNKILFNQISWIRNGSIILLLTKYSSNNLNFTSEML